MPGKCIQSPITCDEIMITEDKQCIVLISNGGKVVAKNLNITGNL